MLRISYRIVARQMATVAVTGEKEIGDVSNADSPSLDMLDKVVDALIWCRFFLEILLPIAATVARMVKQVKGEVFFKSCIEFVHDWCRAAISMRKN